MKSCAVVPAIKNKDGKLVGSRLFKDLLSYTNNNRENTKKIWLLTKLSEFISNHDLLFDENGEVTFDSLQSAIDLSSTISQDSLLQDLSKLIGSVKKDGTLRRYMKEDDVFSKVRDFNKNSPYRDKFIATYNKAMDRKDNYVYWVIHVSPKTKLNAVNVENIEYNYNLNQKLREKLASWGVTTGALTELENRMSIAGVMDTTQAREAANGLIEVIRLAKGERGEKALPEEFAHFAFEALGDDPLSNRMINLLTDNNLVTEILGEDYTSYYDLYLGNTATLAKEAVGKLLSKHLLRNESIPTVGYKALLNRLIDKIKNFFSKFDTNSLRKLMVEADTLYGLVAKDIMDGSININIDHLTTPTKLYQVDSTISNEKKLLLDIIDTEAKRLSIYLERNPDGKFDEKQRTLINELQKSLSSNKELEGIYTFLENTTSQLKAINSRLAVLYTDKDEVLNVNTTASTLRDIRNFVSAYSGIVQEVRSALRDDERGANRYEAKVKERLNEVSGLLSDILSDYAKIGIPLFAQFLKPFIGDSLVVPIGKYRGKTMRVEELLSLADNDISFFERWLDSAAESSDIIIKLLDASVKKSKELARLRSIDKLKELQAMLAKLESQGVKDTEFMYERDSEDKLTGYYISEIDSDKYRVANKKFLAELSLKYPNPTPDQVLEMLKAKTTWLENNKELVDGKWQPKLSIYGSERFRNLNTAQREYFDKFMEIKAEMDDLIPSKYTYPTKAVQVRKDLVERVKASDNLKTGGRMIFDNIKDLFLRRVDDVDLGTKSTLIDFEGNEVQLLPIYYTRKLEDMSVLSTDATSTMAAYAAMAIDFDEMNKVIDALELGRDILRDRKVVETEGDKPKMERIKSMGRTIENTLTKRGEASRIVDRVDDFFRMQIYGLYQADEGYFNIFGQPVDKGKLANFINRMTSLNSFALNLLAGIANVGQGTIMMNTEAAAGEYFNAKDVAIADKNYSMALPHYLGEIGNRIHTSKIALWNEMFNTMQEYEGSMRELDNVRKTWLSRAMSTSSLFFINNAGEHWMQSRTSLAVANTFKMKDKNGNLVSLWEAMEVKSIDPNKPNLGAKLLVKEGYTKQDGTPFTKDDIIQFSTKVKAINQRMHGIYNKADKNAFQRVAIGRLAMMFRKWMRPAYNRRFGAANYNADLNQWTEGYYNSTSKFLWLVMKDLRKLQFNVVARWGQLNNHQKSNIIRSATEAGHLLALSLILGLVDWSDDKNRPWAVKMAEYQLTRLLTEIGALVPGPQMLKEVTTLIKSPAAGVDYVERIMKLGEVTSYFDVLESGRFKGHTKLYKNFIETLPLNKPIYKAFNPDESIKFYNGK